MADPPATVRDRRQTPTNIQRRAAAHELLDRAFDTAAASGRYCRLTLDIDFHNGTAQHEIAYGYGERLQ